MNAYDEIKQAAIIPATMIIILYNRIVWLAIYKANNLPTTNLPQKFEWQFGITSFLSILIMGCIIVLWVEIIDNIIIDFEDWIFTKFKKWKERKKLHL